MIIDCGGRVAIRTVAFIIFYKFFIKNYYEWKSNIINFLTKLLLQILKKRDIFQKYGD